MKYLIVILCLVCLGGCNIDFKPLKDLNDYSKGSCAHCDDHWNWKEEHATMYKETSGMFPLCEECFSKMTYPYVLWYHLKQFEEWGCKPTDKEIETLSHHIARYKIGNLWAVSWIKEKMYKNGKLISIYEVKR